MESYYIGVDVGTASVRAALITHDGRIVSSATKPLQIWQPLTDYYEQSSEDVWRNVCLVVKVFSKFLFAFVILWKFVHKHTAIIPAGGEGRGIFLSSQDKASGGQWRLVKDRMCPPAALSYVVYLILYLSIELINPLRGIWIRIKFLVGFAFVIIYSQAGRQTGGQADRRTGNHFMIVVILIKHLPDFCDWRQHGKVIKKLALTGGE